MKRKTHRSGSQSVVLGRRSYSNGPTMLLLPTNCHVPRADLCVWTPILCVRIIIRNHSRVLKLGAKSGVKSISHRIRERERERDDCSWPYEESKNLWLVEAKKKNNKEEEEEAWGFFGLASRIFFFKEVYFQAHQLISFFYLLKRNSNNFFWIWISRCKVLFSCGFCFAILNLKKSCVLGLCCFSGFIYFMFWFSK